MKIINPITVDDSILTSSTIPEPDASRGEVEWTAGAYSVGDEVIKSSTHKIYKCAVDTSDDPEQGVSKSPPTWVDIGSTNRYRMFNDRNGSKSSADFALTVEITPNQAFNAIAGFYVSGATSIEITMTDPLDGVVYNQFVEMQDNSEIVDYYEWFFYPLYSINRFIKFDLPTYTNATLKVEVLGIGAVEIGSMPFGTQTVLGAANFGTSLDLIDMSRKEQDEFGNYTIVERPAFDVVDFDVSIPTSKTRYVNSLIAQYRNRPLVWFGGEDSETSIFTFGYYKSFRVTIDAPSISSASLQIEELI